MNKLECLKLAIISTDKFSDKEVKKLFLDFEINSLEEINELCAALAKHRPKLLKELSDQCKFLRTS